jgi:hypothetical protein
MSAEKQVMMRMESNGRIISPFLPEIGSEQTLKDFGKVKVVLLYHDDRDNFIVLEHLENKPMVLTHPFEVCEKPSWLEDHDCESELMPDGHAAFCGVCGETLE